MSNPTTLEQRPTRAGRGFRRGDVVALILALLLIATGVGQWALRSFASADSTIMGDAAPPHLEQHPDDGAVELGTRFTVRADGTATGMRFWKLADAGERHHGTLWTAEGERLARASFTSETDSGWQTARFDERVSLKAGATYVVSYHAPEGRYAVTYDANLDSVSPVLDISPGFGVFAYATRSEFPDETYRNSSYWVDILFAADTTSVAGSTSAPAPHPAPSAPAAPDADSRTPSTPSPDHDIPDEFPSASTTGVPTGTVLSDYTGPCVISKPGTVIDAKRVVCGPLLIEAPGVVITRSHIQGIVHTAHDSDGSFTISDSQVDVGPVEGTGIGDARFTATRVHVTGGNRSVNCFLDCTLEDSYLHGQFRDDTGRAHESGVRMGSNSVIRGNTIACDAPEVPPDAGCSAALTGYGDFAAVRNNTIEGNFFVAKSGGYCAYGGSTAGKPFSGGARDIRFLNNVWQRGEWGTCGGWGPITSFDSDAPGNEWINNRWDDGTPVPPAN